jgi:NDP-sugar pyrophosphorylase family protein
VHTGFWWEFGRPELYLDGSLELIGLDDELRARIAPCDPVRRIGSAAAAIGDDVRVHPTARLEGRVAIGAGAELGESASVEDSVLMPGAEAPAGCRLRRAVLAPGIRLPAGFKIEDALACYAGGEPRLAEFGRTGRSGR